MEDQKLSEIQNRLYGCLLSVITDDLETMSAQDGLMWAMSELSDAQELLLPPPVGMHTGQDRNHMLANQAINRSKRIMQWYRSRAAGHRHAPICSECIKNRIEEEDERIGHPVMYEFLTADMEDTEQRSFATLDEALEYGKAIGSKSMIDMEKMKDGPFRAGTSVWNPQTGVGHERVIGKLVIKGA